MPPRATATPKSSQNLLRVPVGASSVLTAGRLLRAGATPTGPARYGFEVTSRRAQLFWGRTPSQTAKPLCYGAKPACYSGKPPCYSAKLPCGPRKWLAAARYKLFWRGASHFWRGASCFGAVQAVLAWCKLFWRGARPSEHAARLQMHTASPKCEYLAGNCIYMQQKARRTAKNPHIRASNAGKRASKAQRVHKNAEQRPNSRGPDPALESG
jgi:hypothetical protein